MTERHWSRRLWGRQQRAATARVQHHQLHVRPRRAVSGAEQLVGGGIVVRRLAIERPLA